MAEKSCTNTTLSTLRLGPEQQQQARLSKAQEQRLESDRPHLAFLSPRPHLTHALPGVIHLSLRPLAEECSI